MAYLLNVSEVIEFAVYIEQNGYKFYVESMKKVKDEKMIDLFQFMADEEFRHENLFKQLLEKTGKFSPHESYSGEYESYMRDFLKTHSLANDQALKAKIDSIQTTDDAIRMALDFEKDSIVLFSMLKNIIEEENKPTVEGIIQEEITHIAKINRFKLGLIK